jgi:cbb3-type cytochrome oxidase maturation protein
VGHAARGRGGDGGPAFWMAVEGGQFDDLDGPAVRVVTDDDVPR